jgi:hypothetical protein
VSKPFIVSSVIILFAGTTIGAAWMMTIFGIDVPQWFGPLFQQHKVLQIDGFLTLLIMGVGYMIVPRFRNISLPAVKAAYLSFFLILSSLVIQLLTLIQPSFLADKILIMMIIMIVLRVSGVSIFVTIVFLTLKIRLKRQRLSDYFMALSVVTLLTLNVVELAQMFGATYSDEGGVIEPLLAFDYPLGYIELWLLFPITMIFGIEYKTLPSFLGFIRPRSNVGLISFILVSTCIVIGILSVVHDTEIAILQIVFNAMLLISVIIFAISVYVFGGFDNSEIKRLVQGEKKVRYNLTVVHIKISFLLLLSGIFMAFLFAATYGDDLGTYDFALYDLAIHTVAIGFIGVTISLYLPLMLPPITGTTVKFTNLNKIPLLLIVSSLALRALGDIFLAQGNLVLLSDSQYLSISASIILGFSGWLVVIAMVVFILNIHRNME